MIDKCNQCNAVESEVPILFSIICERCYLSLPFESRRQILEDAASRISSTSNLE